MDAFIASQWRTVTTGEAFVNGAWRVLQYGEAYVDGDWRRIVTFILPMTMTIDDKTVIARRTPVTAKITPALSGGLAPYTYLWERLSGTGIAISSTTIAAPTFSAGLADGDSATSVYRCTVTDSIGTSVADTATVYFEYNTLITD
jgi:hypothetical protein